MRRTQAAFAVLALLVCLSLAACELLSILPGEAETTTGSPPDLTTPRVEETTPEETTPEETTPAVTEPDFPNEPDPDGTKRY